MSLHSAQRRSKSLSTMAREERLPQVRGSGSSARTCDSDTSEDVEVTKAILLREEYTMRVRRFLQRQSLNFGEEHTAFNDLVGLLDLLRAATIDAVEAIQQWRGAHGHHEPFVWDGMNYLLKISVDLNFLDDHKVTFRMSRWLGLVLLNPRYYCIITREVIYIYTIYNIMTQHGALVL